MKLGMQSCPCLHQGEHVGELSVLMLACALQNFQDDSITALKGELVCVYGLQR